MLKIAVIDDGIPQFITQKFPNINVHYLYVQRGCIYRQKFRQYRRKITHAGLCFYEYAVHIGNKKVELYSISVLRGRRGNITEIITALKWCLENGTQIVNMSVGSRNYWDYFTLDPILKELWEKKIIVVAAHANTFQFSFPAISKYSISARFVDGDFLQNAKYAVIESNLPNVEIVCSKDEISDFVRQFIDVEDECNSLAAPVVSAMITEIIYSSKNGSIDSLFHTCEMQLGGQDLWNIRRQYIGQTDIQIPVILFRGEKKIMQGLLKGITDRFLKNKYKVLTLNSPEPESEFPYFDLDKVLANCNGEICNAVIFMASYSAVDIMLVYVNKQQEIQLCGKGMAEIVIMDNQTFKIDTEHKNYSNEDDLFESLINLLTH